MIIHGFGQRHSLLAHGFAGGFADERRGRLFNDFLVAALDGALALVEVNHVAKRIAQHLNFDVARLLDKFFDEHAIVAKAVARLVAARLEAFGRLFVVEGHAQTLAAAARAGFDHDGVANVFGNAHGLIGRIDRIVITWDGTDLGLQRQFFGGDFVAHGSNGCVLGADKDQALFFHALGKAFVFGQKTITGVDGFSARLLGRSNDFVGHQVRLA